MADNFQLYSKYYDLLYENKDYESEATYIKTLITSHVPAVKTVLELGCGTGNHAEFLCKDGLRLTGLEQSAAMVELARKKQIKGFEPRVNDIADFNLPEKYDAAISLFHVISYLTSNTSLISCFESVNRHLNTGGIFVFDVWYSPAVYYNTPETRIKRLENPEISVTRLAEPVIHTNHNLVDVNYEIIIKNKISQQAEIVTETHTMRHFSTPELELLAINTGFTLLRSEEFLTGKEPGKNTWGVCFILQKN